MSPGKNGATERQIGKNAWKYLSDGDEMEGWQSQWPHAAVSAGPARQRTKPQFRMLSVRSNGDSPPQRAWLLNIDAADARSAGLENNTKLVS